MAARITQSVVEAITLLNSPAHITQSVVEAIVGLGITCDSPPVGAVGVAYAHTFPAGSGTPPYGFTIAAGALPPGLVLNGATGVVSGAPLAPGVYSFTVRVTDVLTTQAQAQCSITVTGTAITASSPTIVGGQGEQHSRGGCSGFNVWDYCMLAEMKRWRHIRTEDLCVIPKEHRNLLPWDETFGAIPKQAVPFRIARGIVTPDAAQGDVVVASGRIPTGYDGIITGYYFFYSGSGFVQGSGDIVTRLRINQRYVKDLGNNFYLLGTPVEPLPMTEGQLILSGMEVQAIVNVPNLSGLINVNASTVFAGLIGFAWPRG